MIELFLEGQPVDVNESFSTQMTYAVDDIKDFASRNTSFSKTIVLPGTKRNNYLFGSIFNPTSSSAYSTTTPNFGYNFNAAMSAKCYIFSDNIQVFKGVLRLLEVTINDDLIEYEVAVFGELGGFASKLGNLKLEALDFSAYDHTYNITNITGSWNTASAGSGYYYPLIDYGNYSTNKKDWQYRTLRPALYVKEYIDKIFAAAGYTYNCPLFGTTRFKSLIVPYNRQKLSNYKPFTLDIATTSLSAYSQADGTSKVIPFNVQTIVQDFTPNGTNSEYTYTGAGFSGTATFRFKGQWRKNSAIPFTLEWQKNGVTFYTITWEASTSYPGYTAIDNTYSIPISLATSDVLRMVAKQSTATLFNIDFDTGLTRMQVSTGAIVAVEANINDTIKVNDLIPRNVLQKDFFSSILKLFNLYVYESNDQEKLLNITPYVDFYNLADSIDWSHKIDLSKQIKIKPLSELNARYYEFNYKNDSDYYNELYQKRYGQAYGSYLYDSGFEFANEKKTIELIFSGTPLVGYGGEDKVYSTIFKKNQSTEDQFDSNIRILQAKKVTGVASWTILNGATVLGTYTDYGYAGHLDDPDAPANDINFGVPNELFFTLAAGSINVNQFNVYWSSYMAEITDKDSKMLSGMFKLDYKDIYELDFSKYIYLFGSLWRLNKIEDFNATNKDLCRVQLIKVIEKLY